MKKVLSFLQIMVLTLVVIGLNGCSKDSDSNGGTVDPSDNFSAKVDGVSYSTDMDYRYLTNPSNSFSMAKNVSINDVFHNWAIQFFGDTVGTYPFTTGFPNPGEGVGSYSEGPFSNLITYEATNGSIVVSSVDTVNSTISGTFSFTGDDGSGNTVNVTEGKFTDVPKF